MFKKLFFLVFGTLFFFFLNEEAIAKYIGADPPKRCQCEEGCNPNQSCSSGNCNVCRTQGTLIERYFVTSLQSNGLGATVDFSLVYNSYNADNSRAQINTGMGYGWTHSYNIFLFQQRGHMFRMDGDGLVTRYQLGPDGKYTASTGYFEELKASGGKFFITQKDGTIYEFAIVPSTPFYVGGPVWRLMSVADRNGNKTDLTYTSGDLTGITDTFGRTLTLGYSGHKLVSVTDPLNRTTKLAYDPTGKKLASITDPAGKSVNYTYNFLYQLTIKVDKDSRKTTFLYNNLKPVGAKDGLGNNMFNLSNPVNWATDPGALANQQMLVYIPSTTTNADGRGNNWQYEYDEHGYITRAVAPDGSETKFTYDPATLMLALKTDANNHTTSYEYDALGNLTDMTDALLYETVYEYNNPDCPDKGTRITYPNGSITEYQYDAACNRIQEVRDVGGLNIVTQWTYYAPLESGNPSPAFGIVKTEEKYNVKPGGAEWQVTKYEYDIYGNRAKVIDPENCVTTYEYDIVGNRRKMIDANNNPPTVYDYDALNRLVKETDPLGFTTEYKYDGNGNRTEVKKQVAKSPDTFQITTYQYDVRNRLIQEIRDPGGLNLVTKYAYDNNDNRISVTDPRNKVTKFEYDLQNRLSKVIDVLNNITETLYDGVGNRTCLIDANGHYTFNEYDELNRIVRESKKVGTQECTTGDADDIVSQYFYDNGGAIGCPSCGGPSPGSGNISKIIDPEGKVTCFKYDKVDRRKATIRKVGDTDCSIVDGDDWMEFIDYDSVGNVLRRTDPNGNPTTFTYYLNNWLMSETNAENETTSYTYDCVGNVKTVTVPGGNVTTNKYNERNELVLMTDRVQVPSGVVAAYDYDGVGNRKVECDGNNNCTQYDYDSVNRLTAVTDAKGEVTRYAYDKNGNLNKTTDREGHVTCYLYDDINRRTFTAQLMGGGTNCALLAFNDIWTKTHYDGVGNVISLTTAKHGSTPDQCNGTSPPGDCETTKYKYDEVNRLIRETYPDSGIRTFTYDKAGNLKTRKDQKGIITDYNYNDLYYLTLRAYPSSSDSFSYDIGGRMTYAERGAWVVTFEYDRANRVKVTTQNGQVVKYDYDIPKRFRTNTYPAGRIVTEAMDERSRLSTVNRGAGPIFPITPIALYTYDLGNRVLTRQYENSTTATYSYNQNNWITDLTHIGPTPIASFGYDYDKEGNKRFEEKRHDTNRSEAYQYDKVYRLIDYKVGNLVGATVPLPITQTAYNLDKLGNWDSKVKDGVTQNRQHNQVNELTKIDGVDLIYDNNGNLIENGNYFYTYDEENRLTAVTRKADSKVVGQYQYDALSRRIVKVADPDLLGSNPVATLYFYDDARIVEEQNTLGATQATYVYGNYIDEILTMARGGQPYYYHQNSLGSVAAVTDKTGAVVERHEYDAYGKVTIYDNSYTQLPSSAIGNPYMFTGREYDQETGLYYYRARYYSPTLGRFLQRDPLGYVDGMHLYEYVKNNGVNRIDPLGFTITREWQWEEKSRTTRKESYEAIYASLEATEHEKQCKKCWKVKVNYEYDEIIYKVMGTTKDDGRTRFGGAARDAGTSYMVVGGGGLGVAGGLALVPEPVVSKGTAGAVAVVSVVVTVEGAIAYGIGWVVDCIWGHDPRVIINYYTERRWENLKETTYEKIAEIKCPEDSTKIEAIIGKDGNLTEWKPRFAQRGRRGIKPGWEEKK